MGHEHSRVGALSVPEKQKFSYACFRGVTIEGHHENPFQEEIRKWLFTCHIPETAREAGMDKSHLYRIRVGERPISLKMPTRLSTAIDYLQTQPKKPRGKMKPDSVRGKIRSATLERLKKLHQDLFGKAPYVPPEDPGELYYEELNVWEELDRGKAEEAAASPRDEANKV